jgi:AraC-like DNA-binding protein
MRRPDRHNEVELNFLTKGSLTYLLSGAKVTVGPRRLVAFWAAVPHQILGYRDLRSYYVATVPLAWVLTWELPGGFMKALLEGRVVQDADPDRSELDLAALERWRRDLRAGRPEIRDAVLLELRARLLRLALGGRPSSPTVRSARRGPPKLHLSRAERMAAYVALNYTGPLKADDVARHVGLSADHASRLFKESFGVTLGAFLTQHRVAHAQRLLVTTDAKVVSIAFESGFGSLSRFNAAFRSLCGCTPREYRRGHRP